MAKIIESTEQHGLSRMTAIDWQPRTRGGVIAKAAAEVAERVGAKYLVAFTQSGDSARRLSRYRGPIPMIAFTPIDAVRSQLALSWGIETFKAPEVEHTDEMVRQVDEHLLRINRLKEGELTYSRYQSTAQQVYLAVIGNLREDGVENQQRETTRDRKRFQP